MAVLKTFSSSLWSDEMLVKLKGNLVMAGAAAPKRDKYSQMLRDKALGHPEFPRNMTYYNDGTVTEIQNAHNDWADAAAYAMSTAIDRDILRTVYKSRDGE
jgi:hypothetical protein